ncbi:MAG TPA: XrtA/PEP-CTERM system TPR-repeat protein PrsT [Burkholderiales bacterium]|nr:XrtA/PEP-CTERM system TPR-repeat protein PrsT [Burkholderiales bacterium]
MKLPNLPRLGASAVMTALTAALAAGCGQDSPDKLVASAKAYMAVHDQRAATIQLKNALQAEPQNAEARYLLGVSLSESGDYVSAEKEFRRALEYGYPAERVYPRLAQSLVALGEFKKATAELEVVKLADPAAEAAVKTTLAEAYLAQGQRDEARAAAAAALAAKPGYPQARVVQARIMAGARDLEGATKIADEVLASSPALPEALALKAELLIASGNPAEAAQVLTELVKARPYNSAARFTLISLLIDSKDYERAATEIAAMRKAIPNDMRSRYLEALVAFRKGEPAKAREPLQQVLKVAPDNAPSLLLAGAIELQLGATAAAEEHLRRVLARYPNSLVARNLLTVTYLRTGRPAKAEEELEPALRGAPQNPAVLRLAGEVALANNRLADAARYYDQAAAAAKDDVAIRTRAAQLRFATGDVDRAFKDLEEASGLDESNYQADLALIAAHLRRKEYDKALAAVATLEKKQPKNPLTYNMKGGVYLAMRDRKNAQANFERALQLQSDYLPAAANLARLDLAEKRPDDARKRFEAIVAKAPKNEGAILALAQIQAATGTPAKEVAATLERAVAADPQSAAARLALIAHYGQARDAKAALATAQAAAAALPNDVRIMEALALAQLGAGDTNQAIATFNRLVGALPQSPAPLMRLAAVHFGAKDYDAALQALRKALVLSPDNLEVAREIIVVQLAAGRVDEAVKEARDVQRRRPKQAIGFAMEGDVLANQKKFTEAAKVYAEASKRQALPQLVVREHQLLTAAGQPASGDAVVTRWLKQNPKDTVVRMYLADREIRDKNFRQASRQYREVLALQPENAIALNNLAWSLYELKDPAAEGHAEKAYELAPGNLAIQDTYGWILVNQGDAKRGAEILGKAAAAAPNALEIRMHYAKALLKAGDTARARQELEAVASAKNDSPLKGEAAELLKQL